ncbi:GIY-YIG nuclease family protein [Blastomonas sp. AAP53]|uniref:GIY-YIG nuclease family protein n=1 Tax=Blastomonas sp. AAP53 TaxID=1248760 RepID=UPI00035DCA74|nr:GIY-YIG nuclease family protein [Blastomonas sp. AAP53]
MAFWVYILKCADGRFYTGHTDDLERRMGEHQYGGFCDFTSRRRPVELVWSDWYQTRDNALEVEHQIKSWSRAKKIGLINGDWEMVSLFARPPHERPSTSLGTDGGGGNPSMPKGEVRK